MFAQLKQTLEYHVIRSVLISILLTFVPFLLVWSLRRSFKPVANFMARFATSDEDVINRVLNVPDICKRVRDANVCDCAHMNAWMSDRLSCATCHDLRTAYGRTAKTDSGTATCPVTYDEPLPCEEARVELEYAHCQAWKDLLAQKSLTCTSAKQLLKDKACNLCESQIIHKRPAEGCPNTLFGGEQDCSKASNFLSDAGNGCNVVDFVAQRLTCKDIAENNVMYNNPDEGCFRTVIGEALGRDHDDDTRDACEVYVDEADSNRTMQNCARTFITCGMANTVLGGPDGTKRLCPEGILCSHALRIASRTGCDVTAKVAPVPPFTGGGGTGGGGGGGSGGGGSDDGGDDGGDSGTGGSGTVPADSDCTGRIKVETECAFGNTDTSENAINCSDQRLKVSTIVNPPDVSSMVHNGETYHAYANCKEQGSECKVDPSKFYMCKD